MENTIFDDVFRTIVEKMPDLVIPLINEVFHTDYQDDIKVTTLQNEHITRNGEKVTDSCLLIGDHLYHLECQAKDDATMAIRMVEYDFAVALQYAEKSGNKYIMKFPRSCVLYLRNNKNTGNTLSVTIEFPDSTEFVYSVPTLRAQTYSKEEIFEKRLLILLPYYVLRYEKQQLGENTEELKALFKEYKNILDQLNIIYSDSDKGDEYYNLRQLIIEIADYVFRDRKAAKEGVDNIMGGKVLQLASEQYTEQGEIKGTDRANLKSITNVMHSLNCDQIKAMDILGLSEKEQERYTQMLRGMQP